MAPRRDVPRRHRTRGVRPEGRGVCHGKGGGRHEDGRKDEAEVVIPAGQSSIGGSPGGGVFGPWRSVRRRSRRWPSSYQRRGVSPPRGRLAHPQGGATAGGTPPPSRGEAGGTGSPPPPPFAGAPEK